MADPDLAANIARLRAMARYLPYSDGFSAEDEEALGLVLDLVESIPPDRLNPWHTLTIKPASWHLSHPITCDLITCPFDAIAERWPDPPAAPGVYHWHHADDPWEPADGG